MDFKESGKIAFLYIYIYKYKFAILLLNNKILPTVGHYVSKV